MLRPMSEGPTRLLVRNAAGGAVVTRGRAKVFVNAFALPATTNNRRLLPMPSGPDINTRAWARTGHLLRQALRDTAK